MGGDRFSEEQDREFDWKRPSAARNPSLPQPSKVKDRTSRIKYVILAEITPPQALILPRLLTSITLLCVDSVRVGLDFVEETDDVADYKGL